MEEVRLELEPQLLLATPALSTAAGPPPAAPHAHRELMVGAYQVQEATGLGMHCSNLAQGSQRCRDEQLCRGTGSRKERQRTWTKKAQRWLLPTSRGRPAAVAAHIGAA
eukprot:4059551-Prymnesium_polylepis.2